MVCHKTGAYSGSSLHHSWGKDGLGKEMEPILFAGFSSQNWDQRGASELCSFAGVAKEDDEY